jgi:hypothetical protein
MNLYYCNNQGFKTYESARVYADKMVAQDGIFYVIFTRVEWITQFNHEEECGK